jgi:hypothetical protein
MTTKGQEIAADIAALLRARNPLIWITTREEARVERLLFEAAASVNYEVQTWDIAQGTAGIDGKKPDANLRDPGDVMNVIRTAADTASPKRTAWIFRDLPIWLGGPPGATPLRQLRNLARYLPGVPRDAAQAMIIITPSSDVPPELANHATVIEWPLPDRAEIAAIFDAAIESLPEEMRAASLGARDAAIDSAIGLTGEEAASCFARSLVQLRKVDPASVAKEKRRVIAREKVLEWFDPLPGGLDAVGGLENLKAWLVSRSSAYSPAARAYGLPAPKGALLAGIPGCGKTLTAKAIATAWGVPLLRVDLGAIKSKFVGESENNLRKAFRVIETVGRCVVWFDEIEKALQGATSGSADGGVSSDALGAVLSWMQERQGEAFVIATANDVESLPPELLRKGRFDEIWWVDLPTESERGQIIQAALRAHNRATIDGYGEVAKVTAGFTGSEVAALVPDALYAAFADGARPVGAGDLIAAAKTVVPLSKTAAEKITKLRDWATGRARQASASEGPVDVKATRRQIDL